MPIMDGFQAASMMHDFKQENEVRMHIVGTTSN